MAEVADSQKKLLLTLALVGLGGLIVWLAGVGPFVGTMEAQEQAIRDKEAEIRQQKQAKEAIAGRQRQIDLLDGAALHLDTAAADQHCQQLMYKWASAGAMESALVRTLGPSRLAAARLERGYSLKGVTTLEGVRGILYAIQSDPTDAQCRRIRRLDMSPDSAREPAKLRIDLTVGWLASELRGIAPSSRPAAPAVQMARYDAVVDRGMFIPYSPPQQVAAAPPPPPQPTPGQPPRERLERPRQENWQLSLVADAGAGPEAEFLDEMKMETKRISTGDTFVGYRVHQIDLKSKSVILRQGELLFEVPLGAYFSQRKMVGKYQPPPEEAQEPGRQAGGPASRPQGEQGGRPDGERGRR
jgi:hypothetical protein